MQHNKYELVVSEKPDDNWNEHIAQCDGNVYHSRRWMALAARHNKTPLFLSWRLPNGEVVGIATAHKSQSAMPLIGQWSSLLSMGSTPAIREDYRSDCTALFLSLRDYAKSAGCKAVSIESHMGQALGFDNNSVRFQEKPRIEFRIDLTADEDDIWARMSKHHRRKIRKSGRHDISIQSHRSADAVSALRSLQRGSQVRRLERGEQMHLGADQPVIDLIQGILDQGLGRLYLAESDGEVISGALISTYGERVYYVFGGSSPRGFSLDVPGLLFWETIKECKKDGYSVFNLGGVPAEAAQTESQAHGLYRFKSGFGGNEVSRADYSANLRPLISAVGNLGATILRRS